MHNQQYYDVAIFLINYGLCLSLFSIFILCTVLFFSLWLISGCIIHAYKYNKTENRDFWLWTLVLSSFVPPGILFGLLASIVYYFIYRPNLLSPWKNQNITQEN